MKPTKEQIEAYKEMAKASPTSMKAMIEENLKATCDKYAGHEDKLDDCIDYLTECARGILGSKSGEVDNETCFRICRDYFNDEIWAIEDQEKAEGQKKSAKAPKKAKKEKTAKAPKMTAAQVEKEALEKENERIEKLKEKHGLKQPETQKAEPAPEPVQIKPTCIQPEPGQLDFFALMGV